jgi:hypothetical protein
MSSPGAQTERRGDPAPVWGLLGGKAAQARYLDQGNAKLADQYRLKYTPTATEIGALLALLL